MGIFNRSFTTLFFGFALLLLTAISNATQAQTLYSRSGGGSWSSAGTWSLISHAGASCGCTPLVTNDVKIGAGHTVTIGSNTTVSANSVTVNDDAAGGSLVLGD